MNGKRTDGATRIRGRFFYVGKNQSAATTISGGYGKYREAASGQRFTIISAVFEAIL